MSETENPRPVFRSPAMTVGSEAELLSEPQATVRVSGFIALLLGGLSFAALFAGPLMIVPGLAAIAAGVALRPYSGLRPAGLTAALIGLFLATLFGFWGATERRLQYQTLSSQAAQFASRWLDLVAQGDVEMALQLSQHPSFRQSASMSLVDYYQTNAEAQTAMKNFKEAPANLEILRAGNAAKWEQERPSEIYHFSGRKLLTTYWRDRSGTIRGPIVVRLEFIPAAGDKPAQWMIDGVDIDSPPLPGV